YHGPVTADVSDAVRRNVTIYTERGEGGTSVGRCLALLAAGRITAKPLVTHQFPLARVREAMETLERRTGDPLSEVVEPCGRQCVAAGMCWSEIAPVRRHSGSR